MRLTCPSCGSENIKFQCDTAQTTGTVYYWCCSDCNYRTPSSLTMIGADLCLKTTLRDSLPRFEHRVTERTPESNNALKIQHAQLMIEHNAVVTKLNETQSILKQVTARAESQHASMERMVRRIARIAPLCSLPVTPDACELWVDRLVEERLQFKQYRDTKNTAQCHNATVHPDLEQLCLAADEHCCRTELDKLLAQNARRKKHIETLEGALTNKQNLINELEVTIRNLRTQNAKLEETNKHNAEYTCCITKQHDSALARIRDFEMVLEDARKRISAVNGHNKEIRDQLRDLLNEREGHNNTIRQLNEICGVDANTKPAELVNVVSDLKMKLEAERYAARVTLDTVHKILTDGRNAMEKENENHVG